MCLGITLTGDMMKVRSKQALTQKKKENPIFTLFRLSFWSLPSLGEKQVAGESDQKPREPTSMDDRLKQQVP